MEPCRTWRRTLPRSLRGRLRRSRMRRYTGMNSSLEIISDRAMVATRTMAVAADMAPTNATEVSQEWPVIAGSART